MIFLLNLKYLFNRAFRCGDFNASVAPIKVYLSINGGYSKPTVVRLTSSLFKNLNSCISLSLVYKHQ